MDQFPVRPCDIHPEPSAGCETFNSPMLPCCRESRQEINRILMALQEHLRDPCGAAEIPIDLEREVRIMRFA